MTDPSTGSGQQLARQAVRGTLAVFVANTTARVVSFLGSLYVMDRLLPDEFGTVAYAASLLAICDSLTNWGFAQAATHRQERVGETFSTYLVLRLAMLVGLLGILGAVALPLHKAIEQCTRFDVLLLLAAGAVVDAAYDVPAARLSRAMRFQRLAAVDVASRVLATGVVVAMAATGFGFWALVASRLVFTLVRAVMLSALTLEPTAVGFHAQDALWLIRFGFPLWFGSLATSWVLHYDDLVVGRMRGKATLGFYDRACGLALAPLNLVTGVLTRVSFPLYARLQSDRARLSEAFRIASGTTLRLATPMALGLALVVPDFLAVMRWAQWEPVTPIFRWLLVYAMLRPLMDDAGGLLTAIGHPRLTGHTLAAEAAALLVLCPLLTWRWGAEGAAASVGLVVVGGLAVWYVRFLPRFVDVCYVRMLLWPFLSLGAAAGAGLAVDAWAGLGVGLAAGAAKLGAVAVVYVAGLLLLDGRQTLADVRTLRGHAFGREAK